MKKFEIFFGIAKIPIDIFMAILGFSAAYKLRLSTQAFSSFIKPIDFSSFPSFGEYLRFSLISALVLIVILIFENSYRLKNSQTLQTEIKRVLKGCLIWILATTTYFFFTRTTIFSRLTIIYSWTLASTFIVFGRIILKDIQKTLLKKNIGRQNLVFIGKNEISKQIVQTIKKSNLYNIVGYITPSKITEDLERIQKKHDIDEVIQTQSKNTNLNPEEIVNLCDLYHISYKFVPDIMEVKRKNITIEHSQNIPIIHLKATPLDGWHKVTKRIMDIVGAFFGIIILSPIMLATSIAIKLDSKGPILFTKLDNGDRVKRVGQHGKLFNFYKFRSMKPNTDSQRYTTLANKNIRKDSPMVKIENDPRVTKVGNFIRKTSIDELPQLFSVLIGTMSLVGPRPHRPEEVEKYKPHQRFVLTIKPGLTGMAQTNGRSDLEFNKEIKLDKSYIENWSIWLDFKIIFKTIGVIIKGYKE